jgi:hypothetical protein
MSTLISKKYVLTTPPLTEKLSRNHIAAKGSVRRKLFSISNGSIAPAILSFLLIFFGEFTDTVFAQTCDQTARFTRPIPMGISGSNNQEIGKVKGKRTCVRATLGALVVDGSNKNYILGSNSAFADQNALMPGAIIIQPSLADNVCIKSPRNIIGRLSKRIELLFAPHRENLEDAAIAKVNQKDVTEQILNIGGIDSTVAVPQLEMTVQKMGEATCLTFGTITAVNVNIAINYGRGKHPRLANFTNQIAITSTSTSSFAMMPGDSGALILTTDTCPEPVALLLGTGSLGASAVTFASPIQPVLNALNVNFVAGCTADAISSLASQRVENEDPSLEQKVGVATKVRDAHSGELMKIPGAIGSGIGVDALTGVPEIQVYVTGSIATTQSLKNSLVDSVPIVIKETGEVQPYPQG